MFKRAVDMERRDYYFEYRGEKNYVKWRSCKFFNILSLLKGSPLPFSS
jgi:hypothetical protein